MQNLRCLYQVVYSQFLNIFREFFRSILLKLEDFHFVFSLSQNLKKCFFFIIVVKTYVGIIFSQNVSGKWKSLANDNTVVTCYRGRCHQCISKFKTKKNFFEKKIFKIRFSTDQLLARISFAPSNPGQNILHMFQYFSIKLLAANKKLQMMELKPARI